MTNAGTQKAFIVANLLRPILEQNSKHRKTEKNTSNREVAADDADYADAHYLRNPRHLRLHCFALGQNVKRVWNSRVLLFAASEKPPLPPPPEGWFACPKSGEVMSPIIGPGFV